MLTSALLPIFESALADNQGRRSEDVVQQQARSAANSRNGSDLPLRKPPSLSTLAMPSFAGARAVSDGQLRVFSYLISQLPQENRDLVYTVVELIRVTAARSSETKMPLGNLLLVFCPSLNMSPTLLRVLCEADGIWNGPPAQPIQEAVQEATRTSVATDVSSVAHSRAASRTAGTTIDLRLPVIEQDDMPDNVRDSPDDAASFVSALEPPSNGSTRTPSPLIYGSTIPPLLSSDSLDSSSVSEELASPDPPSCRGATDSKSPLASSHSLAIPDVTSVRIVSPRPTVSVPFPSAGGSAPQSPVVHASLSHRKSYTLLSFPHLRSESTPVDVVCEETGQPRRTKRPSLHLLFSKKSSASLPSAGSGNGSTTALNTESISSASSGRPIVLTTASSPPRLDTTISSSPIHIGFDSNVNQLRGKESSTVRSAPPMVMTKLEPPAMCARTDSGGSSLFSTPQSTPIADYYRGRTMSLLLPDAPGEQAPPLRARSASQASETPSIDIDVAETQHDDWTQSVLLAAHAG